MRALPVRWFGAPGRAEARGQAASGREATRPSTVRGEADPALQDERETSALAAVQFTSRGASTPQLRRERLRRSPRDGELRAHRAPGGGSRPESARGRVLLSYSVSAGSRELNSSTIVPLRPRHRGQCGLASKRARSAMLRPQQGQFKNGVAGLVPDVQSVATRLLFPPALGEGAEPPLAFDLESVRERVADRLDCANPTERIGVVAARGGFLRPSEAPRHRSQMTIALATDRCSRRRAHSADHPRGLPKSSYTQAAWCAPFRPPITPKLLEARRAWPPAPASAPPIPIPCGISGASVKGRNCSAPDACVTARPLTVNTTHIGRELEPGNHCPPSV